MMMARELRTEVEIDAPIERVWEAITDFRSYPQWNPFIQRLEGRLAVGERLTVVIRPPGQKARTFRPVVQAYEPNRELRWLGRLAIPGLFDGEHIHQVEALSPDRTRYIQAERFTGLLVPVVPRAIQATEEGFRAMNAALKARAEAGGP